MFEWIQATWRRGTHQMKGVFKRAVPAVLMLTLASFHSTTSADSKCKGLNLSRCTTNSSCLWVTGYVTKNGKQVEGYCRLKSSNKQSSGKEKLEKKSKQSVKDISKENIQEKK